MGRQAKTTPVLLNREEYRRWTEAKPRGRSERVAGEVMAMAAERAAHVRAKARAWRALDRAVRAAGLSCEAMADGMTVEVGDDTDYEPDALVNCGAPIGDEDIAAPNPIIVVEVLSPPTRSLDTGAKLADYFLVPSIQHYLIVRTNRRSVVHHQRRDDGGIETRLLTAGCIALDPPGISFALEEFYAD
jgi:Uma2 family endonuclease